MTFYCRIFIYCKFLRSCLHFSSFVLIFETSSKSKPFQYHLPVCLPRFVAHSNLIKTIWKTPVMSHSWNYYSLPSSLEKLVSSVAIVDLMTPWSCTTVWTTCSFLFRLQEFHDVVSFTFVFVIHTFSISTRLGQFKGSNLTNTLRHPAPKSQQMI